MRGRHASRMNSSICPRYPGPTRAVLDSRGTMSFRISDRRDGRASSIRVCLGARIDSGWRGIFAAETPSQPAARSGSPSSHASTEWTAMRRLILALGSGTRRRRSSGAHPASSSRSRNTNHGDRRAARFQFASRASMSGFTPRPDTGPAGSPTPASSRRTIGSSEIPSTARWTGVSKGQRSNRVS